MSGVQDEVWRVSTIIGIRIGSPAVAGRSPSSVPPRINPNKTIDKKRSAVDRSSWIAARGTGVERTGTKPETHETTGAATLYVFPVPVPSSQFPVSWSAVMVSVGV